MVRRESTGRIPCVHRRRDRSDVAASQGKTRTYRHRQKLGRGEEGFLQESQRKHSPADTLISDF